MVKRDDCNEAEKIYVELLNINDTERGINSHYAYLLFLMKRNERALKYINIEMERQKYLGISRREYFRHGIISRAVGNDDNAEQSFSKVIELIKTDEDKVPVLRGSAPSDPDNYQPFLGFQCIKHLL